MKEGTKLKAIYSAPSEGYHGVIRVGMNDVTELIVTMENGQMSQVPWVNMYVNDKLFCQWNAAELIGIEFFIDE